MERVAKVNWTPKSLAIHLKASPCASLNRDLIASLEGETPIGKDGSHWSIGIKRGKREDLGGVSFRSAMEANYCRYLNYIGARWEYEPRVFDFLPFYPYRANSTYKPDFYLPDTDEYIEVKGYMTRQSKTKLKRMAKHYPEIKIWLVSTDEMKEIERKLGRVIPGWE